jgi:DME family drug/metabolite transporter
VTTLGRGEVYAALAAMSYGSAYVATAFALRSFAAIPTAADRSVLAALVLVAIVAVQRRGGATPPGTPDAAVAAKTRLWHLFILGLLGGAIFLAGQSLAVAHVGATIAAFVAGLYAVLAAVISPFVLGERLGRRALVGFLLALVGTVLLAELDVASADLVGIGWGLAAATAFAFFLVLGRKWSRSDGLDGVTIALATVTVAAPALAVLGAASGSTTFLPATIAPEAAFAMAWLVVVAAGGQALTASSVRLIPASRSAAFLLLNPITATILAVLLLGERPTPLQLTGGGLVLLGIAAATIRRSRPNPG